MKKLFSLRLTTLGIVGVFVAVLTVTQPRGNTIYTYDPNTSKITEACFSTLEVDCTNCTSTECPVPDHGGVDLDNGVEPDAEGTPAGCGSFLLETEKPVLVYNYVNVYGAEHYWYRYRNKKNKIVEDDGYFWQYGHCIAAKDGESNSELVKRIRKAIKNLQDEFVEEIKDAWAGYHNDLADALSDANRNALIGMGASIAAGGGSTYFIAVSAVCYDYYDATRDAKYELFDECDDANADFSEAVKKLR